MTGSDGEAVAPGGWDGGAMGKEGLQDQARAPFVLGGLLLPPKEPVGSGAVHRSGAASAARCGTRRGTLRADVLGNFDKNENGAVGKEEGVRLGTGGAFARRL